MRKDSGKVSNAVIRRLPRYYRHLTELQRQGTERISSSALGKSMDLTASQIRQDLYCFGDFGQQGYGYNVENLRAVIGEILGIQRGHTAVVLGVGNLGRALMQNFKFPGSGFRLQAAFDVDPALVGTRLNGVRIHHADELEDYLRDHPVSVGVLTVPRASALPMALRLAEGGVRGIWNFTNIELKLPQEEVIVENVHFSDSLLTLSYMISQSEEDREGVT